MGSTRGSSPSTDSRRELSGGTQTIFRPGLPIVVPLGAEVLLRVTNTLLMDAVTIHVHGLNKQNLWYTDGVAFVQQCPIHSTN